MTTPEEEALTPTTPTTPAAPAAPKEAEAEEGNNKPTALEQMVRLTRNAKLSPEAADAFMEYYFYQPAREMVRARGGMMSMEAAEEQAYDYFSKGLKAVHKPLLVDLVEDLAEVEPEFFGALCDKWKNGEMPLTREERKQQIHAAYERYEASAAAAAATAQGTKVSEPSSTTEDVGADTNAGA